MREQLVGNCRPIPQRLRSPSLALAGLLRGAALAAAVSLGSAAAACVAGAQTTTGTVRGTVTSEGGQPTADAQIEARNVQSGVVRRGLTRENGTYVLAGLIPAPYDFTIRRIGLAPSTRRIVVQIGATQIQDFVLTTQATTLATVTTTGVAAAPETRTSEVATNVTSQQIQRLPSASRNFLDLAALAPGVTITEDRVGGNSRTFSAGGQSANSVNLFIDGTSLKNDLTGGGVVGQDQSRGNPFPRNAVQEYRVISQNFKAEYQNASSAIITATTRSGGNTWSGNALVGYQNAGLVQLDSLQKIDKKANPAFHRPDYSRTLTAFSIGGPIVKDKAHVFASFEGNIQNRTSRVNIAQPPSGFPALDTVNVTRYNGSFASPFREQLYFVKLDDAVSENSMAELSVSDRHETEIRDFGGNNAYVSASNYRQDVAIAQLKYNYFKGPLLNEAKIDFSNFRRNPTANQPGTPIRDFLYQGGEAYIGTFASDQDFTQRRIGLRDDLTHTGFKVLGDHVFKTGASLDFVTYDILKDNDRTPKFQYTSFTVNGTDTLRYNYATPFQVIYGTGDPKFNAHNNQIGAYAQDDWSPVERLTLNVGVRWDFESYMLNRDYVTPRSVVDTLTRYNSQLPNPLDLSRYISNGHNRKPFYGAFQPRLGFSYGIDKKSHTTVFGGWGLYYDRIPFDLFAVDEYQKIAHPTYTIQFAPAGVAPRPGQIAYNQNYFTTNHAVLDPVARAAGLPEAWLIQNDAKVPRSQQANFGVRQVLGTVTTSLTYAYVHAYDIMALNFGNSGLNPTTGVCCVGFDVGAHGFSNFIYSTNDKETWYNAIQLQVDRPYRRATEKSIGWGFGVAGSYSQRDLKGADNLGDDFEFPTAASIPRHPSNDEKTRIVTNFIADVPYAFGIQASGLLTLGGKVRQNVGCNSRFCPPAGQPNLNPYERGGFTVPGTFPYRTLDLRLRKDFPSFGRENLSYGVTLDVFNVFNRTNVSNYNTDARYITVSGVTKPNPAFGTPRDITTDPRRLQLGLEANF